MNGGPLLGDEMSRHEIATEGRAFSVIDESPGQPCTSPWVIAFIY